MEDEKGESMDPQIKEQIHKRLLDPSGFELMVPKELTLSALAVSDRLVPLFYKMKWSLLTAGHGFFITSDNPVVREVDPQSRHPIYGDHGFLNRSAEVTFPLSRKLLLLLSWDQDAPDQAELKREHFELMNNARAAPLLCAGLIGWRSLRIAGEGCNIGLYGLGAAAHIVAQVARWQETAPSMRSPRRAI